MKSKKANAKRQVVSHTVQPVVGLLNTDDLIRELKNRTRVGIHAMSGMAQHVITALMPTGMVEYWDYEKGWQKVPASNPWYYFGLISAYRIAPTYKPRKKRYCERAFNERGVFARKPNTRLSGEG